MMERLAQAVLAMLAPEWAEAHDTIAEPTSSTSARLDLSRFRWRVVSIQSDQTVALALGPSYSQPSAASLAQGRGNGVRLVAGTIGLTLITDRSAQCSHVADAAGTLWVAPVSRPLPGWLGRLLGRSS